MQKGKAAAQPFLAVLRLAAVILLFIPAVLFGGTQISLYRNTDGGIFPVGGSIAGAAPARAETASAKIARAEPAYAAQTVDSVMPLVVLDAGHGGEDGGAVSADGVAEKTLNLSIVLMLGDMLEAAGVPVVYTRTDDNGLYDGAVPGHRKMADLKNRLAVWSQYPGALFVSVHMNTFSSAKYRGMQVFYSKNKEESKALAEIIRETNQTCLQPENTRACKAADSSIFLLDRCEGTAVLAECGFLSNPEEAALLSDAAYREKVAGVLCASILNYLYGGA
ncbi:MAG: N-acetylmuramoyl-L-alanine amidase [Clostridia bacterium]|nr:N-acetylmuramoyl-L-alanine amidase [Clostridia bacterium]